ncbi:MAG: hypothetical protein VB085_12250 [Peptococcaceae bacterium]|nr:hypothetical protein [Peptococcaceae bacterium]
MDKRKEKTLPHSNCPNLGPIFENSVVTSSMDCTGLVPTPPETDAEAESYENLADIDLPGGKERK